MHPVLVTIDRLTIHSYGVLLLLAVLSAWLVVIFLGKRTAIGRAAAALLCVWVTVIGVAGGKALFLVSGNLPWASFGIGASGLVWYGAPILVILLLPLYSRVARISVWQAYDILCPGTALGQAVGRIGCFLGGCCYGRVTESPLGARLSQSPFLSEEGRALLRHPVQLYESAAMFVFALILLRVFRHRRFDGQVFLTYLLGYAAARIILEAFRGDGERGLYFGETVSTSQIISFGLILAAFSLLSLRLRFVRGKDSPPKAAGLFDSPPPPKYNRLSF